LNKLWAGRHRDIQQQSAWRKHGVFHGPGLSPTNTCSLFCLASCCTWLKVEFVSAKGCGAFTWLCNHSTSPLRLLVERSLISRTPARKAFRAAPDRGRRPSKDPPNPPRLANKFESLCDTGHHSNLRIDVSTSSANAAVHLNDTDCTDEELINRTNRESVTMTPPDLPCPALGPPIRRPGPHHPAGPGQTSKPCSCCRRHKAV
jgi:hypothetical protein